MICAGAVLVLMIPAWFLYPFLIDTLNQPYCDALRGVSGTADCNFLVTNLLDPFSLRLKVAGYGGLFLAMPVILWQLWRFIAPGLYKRERRYAIAFTGSMLTEIGAGLAGGCTASLVVSGGAVLAPAAFLFMAGMFAGGIPAIRLVDAWRRR